MDSIARLRWAWPRRTIVGVCLGLLVLGVFTLDSPQAQSKTKKACKKMVVAYFGSTTGAAAPFASIILPPLTIGEKWVKKTGNVNGCPVTFKVIDSQLNPSLAVTNYKAVSSSLDAAVIIFSNELASVGPLAKANRLPVITDATGYSTVVDNQPVVFSMSPNNNTQTAFAMKAWLKQVPSLDNANVVVFEDVSDAWEPSQAGQAARTLAALGDNVTQIPYQASDTDFTSLVQKAESAKPAAIVIGGDAATAASIAQQVRLQGITAPMLIGPQSQVGNYISLLGSAAQGMYEYNPIWLGSRIKTAQAFNKAFVKLSHVEPAGGSAQIYDGIRMLVTVMRRVHAERLTPAKARAAILKYLRKTEIVGTYGKKLTFDKQGFVAGGGGYLLRLNNGVPRKLRGW